MEHWRTGYHHAQRCYTQPQQRHPERRLGRRFKDDEYANYFVDGILLCTRWKNAGEGQEENREWWEIESIKDGVMKWKALRMREDGTTYTATFEMIKVQ